MMNDTLFGYPEIAYFLKEYLIPNYGLNSSWSEIIFDFETTYRLLNYTPSEGSKFCTNEDTLLHVGNLKFLYQYGEMFDKTV